jgi:hypothetical protein
MCITFLEAMSLSSLIASYRLSSRLPPSPSALKTEVAESLGWSVANCQNARLHIPDDRNRHSYIREILRYRKGKFLLCVTLFVNNHGFWSFMSTIAFVFRLIVGLAAMTYSAEVLVRKYIRGYVIGSFRSPLAL